MRASFHVPGKQVVRPPTTGTAGRRAGAVSDAGASPPALGAPSVSETPVAPYAGTQPRSAEIGANVFANAPSGFDVAASTSGAAARSRRIGRGDAQRAGEIDHPVDGEGVAVARAAQIERERAVRRLRVVAA